MEFQAHDSLRNRTFPCEVWLPEGDGPFPLILFSHHSGGNRRSSTYLTTHLARHGYVVAALDHSETVVKELGRQENETPEQRTVRLDALIAGRVPDLLFLLERILQRPEICVNAEKIGIIGHSFGGWTALAVPDVEPRIKAVVALAPGGASNPKPGILPLKLEFGWGRDVPTLLIAAQNDTSLPLAGMHEIFERIPATKKMEILPRADHLHFADDVEKNHELFRALPGLDDLTKQMRPISELMSGEEAHRRICDWSLAHFDSIFEEAGQRPALLFPGR